MEGGPFEFGNQVLISNHRKLLWSKATVDLARWVRRSTKERANGKQSSPRREDYSPGRRKGLRWLAQIRTFAISQREEFSLCTSKFVSDMPGHAVDLCGGIFRCAAPLPAHRPCPRPP
jgi:hypothetical protein